MKPELSYDTAVEILEKRGYNLNWVRDENQDSLERRLSGLDENASSATVLNMVEIKGQYYDGWFEDPQSNVDFTKFFAESPNECIVGRMMLYMIAAYGESYSYENLIDDVEEVANFPLYEAPFNKDRALEMEQPLLQQ